jgi:hypothetical protein
MEEERVRKGSCQKTYLGRGRMVTTRVKKKYYSSKYFVIE